MLKKAVGRGKASGDGSAAGVMASKDGLDAAIANIDTRCDAIQKRIDEVNGQFLAKKKLISQIGSSKNNALPAMKKKLIATRTDAKRLLQRRKVYENEINQLRNQQMNMHNQQFQLESMQFASQQADAMKDVKKAMGQIQGKLDVQKVVDLQNDNIELGEDLDEVNRILGSVSDKYDIDDGDLEAELEALEMDQVEADHEPLVAQPGKVKVSKNKVDEIDAELEAELDALDLVELPTVPSANPTPVKSKKAEKA